MQKLSNKQKRNYSHISHHRSNFDIFLNQNDVIIRYDVMSGTRRNKSKKDYHPPHPRSFFPVTAQILPRYE